MNLFQKKNFLLALLLSVIIMVLFSIYSINRKKDEINQITDIENKTKILINNIPIYVDIADEPAEHQQGLSGKKSVGENEGLLFVFSSKIQPTFWMKDMLFPIDIIWITDEKVIDIDENVLHEPGKSDTQLKRYSPSEPITHVLEVNAEFVEKNKIKVGDSVNIRF